MRFPRAKARRNRTYTLDGEKIRIQHDWGKAQAPKAVTRAEKGVVGRRCRLRASRRVQCCLRRDAARLREAKLGRSVRLNSELLHSHRAPLRNCSLCGVN